MAMPVRLDDPGAIAHLRECLAAARYAERAVPAVLGAGADGGDLDVAAALRRLAAPSRLATLARLFLLGAPVPIGPARAALRPLGLDRAARLGLIGGARGAVRPRVRLVPYEGLVLASRTPEASRGRTSSSRSAPAAGAA